MKLNLQASKNEIEISNLVSIFDSTRMSYKFLFFKGLLDELKSTHENTQAISLNAIKLNMLVAAWYPSIFFKVNLGKMDQISVVLTNMSFPQISPRNRRKIREVIKSQMSDENLPDILRYVPYRLLTSFYEDELKGVSEHLRNKELYTLSINTFESKIPLYKFLNQNQIQVHPLWFQFLKSNIGLVEDWVSWNWLKYLEPLNSNVPNLSKKLSPPLERKNLKEQTNYWDLVIKNTNLRCIYTNEPLTTSNYELDHFLPWSFVAHDNNWNLIPVISRANREKSDSLPSPKYWDSFIKNQHEALTITKRILPNSRWEKFVSSHIHDLRINLEDVESLQRLDKAYRLTIDPLINLASNMGFNKNWELK